jgi:two-component system cell cycle sensor histidine kinase/response regulator CckA
MLGRFDVAIDVLPRSANEAEVKTVAPCKRQTILLAEDEEVYRRLISSVLQKEGYDILVAENGKEALERAERCQRRIHLLLTDVTMPEVEGPTLARYLQGIWRDLRVIVMSAHPAKMLSLDQGWTFISKPFLASALVQRIRDVLPQSPRLLSEHRQGSIP